MANRFWVGNGGNWSDTAHWSTSSGGAGGASVPTTLDDVKIDSLSFTLTAQTLTVDVSAAALSLDCTGVTNLPTIAGSQTIALDGALTLAVGMLFSVTGTVAFNASASRSITTAGLSLSCNFSFQGSGSVCTLQDSLTTTAQIVITLGTLNTNGKAVSCSNFSTSNSNTRSIILGASTITVSGSWFMATTTNLTFTSGTSTIVMTGANKSFDGGGKTFNNVTFSGSSVTVSGSNTFGTATIGVGKTVKLTSGTTQTITSLNCNGTTASPSTLQSVTAASAATIALPAGRYFIRHTSIKDITITGATSTTSIAGTDVSGNTGITFVTKFEIGRIKNDGSFNWYSTATGVVTKVSG